MTLTKEQTKHINELLRDLRNRLDDINESIVPMIRIFGTSDRPAEIWFKHYWKENLLNTGDYSEIVKYIRRNN